MKKLNNKNGISLIVLVITIIVMIVLAATIILSLQSTGIIKRANEAKLESDIANKKRAAIVALSEYQLAKQIGETKKTATKYVQDKLKEQGIEASDIGVTEDGEIIVGLKLSALSAIDKGVKLGDYVDYVPTVSISAKYKAYDEEYEVEKGFFATQVNDEESGEENAFKWKYMGIDEKGNALLVADGVTDDEMLLSGAEGYRNGPSNLNDLCIEIYSNTSIGQARSINIEDVNRLLDANPIGKYYGLREKSEENSQGLTIGQLAEKLKYNIENFGNQLPEEDKKITEYVSNWYTYAGEKYKAVDTVEYDLVFKQIITKNGVVAKNPLNYWLASSCIYARFGKNDVNFRVRAVNQSNNIISPVLFDSNGTIGKAVYAIRPVIVLNDNVQFGTKSESGVWSIS